MSSATPAPAANAAPNAQPAKPQGSGGGYEVGVSRRLAAQPAPRMVGKHAARSRVRGLMTCLGSGLPNVFDAEARERSKLPSTGMWRSTV